MAKKKTVSVSVPAQQSEIMRIAVGNDDDEELEGLSGEELDILRALTELEGGQDAKWQIYRKPPLKQGQREGFLTALSSAELSMEEIQHRFGSGKYAIRGFKSNGRFLKQTTVEVATDIDKPDNKASASSNSDTRDVLAIIQEREEKRAERSRELMALTIPAAITGVVSIITAVLSRQQQKTNGIEDMVQLSAALKGLMPPAENALSTADMMFKAMDFATKHAGKGDNSPWVDLAKEAMGTITPLLESRMAQPMQQELLPRQPLQPQLTSNVNNQEQPAMQPFNVMKMMGWARDTLGYLAVKAQQNRDAGLYADWLLDNVPPDVDIKEFAKYIRQESWWTVLQQFQPAVKPYEGWFSEFRLALMEAYADQFETTEGNSDEQSSESGSTTEPG